MSKVITSTVKGFEGTVTLCKPLNIYQCIQVDKAVSEVREDMDKDGNPKKIFLSTRDELAIVALLACAEKWEITGFPEHLTVDNFPTTPRGVSHQFIDLIWKELFKIYMGEVIVPNE